MNAARNVLICNERFLPRFGHDRSLVLLGRELALRGHSVSFACLRCERHVLETITSDIHQLALEDGGGLAEADRLAAEIIEDSWIDHKPDVLVTGGWPFFELAARSGARGVPSLFIDAGAVPHDGYREPTISIQRELRRLRSRTLPFIDCILPNSDFTRDSQTIPDRGHNAGVITIRHGADHLNMGFDAAGIDDCAEQELLSNLDARCRAGFTLILTLGRFEEEGYKNSPMVFDVFARIREQVPDVFLLILAGPATVKVPPRVIDHTMCLTTLSDRTLQEVMRRCRLGLTLSLWEGFNAPLAEMQLAGNPVLAFNLGAHPEVVADPWFLCTSSADMARRAVQLLTQGLPQTISLRRRLAQSSERLGWSETFEHWIKQIESLTANARLTNGTSRRLVLIDVTNSSNDPANSGVINVTRRLAARLSTDAELFVVFAVWDRLDGGYVLPTAHHRSYLESYAGPTDWLGRLIEQSGEYVPLDHVLAAADPRCTRAPVLLFSEVALDGSPKQRASWGRDKGFRLAFILHDMLPVFEEKYIDPEIVAAFPIYVETIMQADAIWANSPFTLREFERYCSSRGLTPPVNREAIQLPGELGGSRMLAELHKTDEIRILCVSTVEPRKQHRALIAAFEELQLRRSDLNLRLILIGNGYPGAESLGEWVKEAARRNNRIEWHGRVSDSELQKEFALATFTVYPSVAEGFGLPIMESLWMGKPCICHECGVMAELAAGGGCLTINVKEPAELSFAMERLSSDTALMDALRRQASGREITTWTAYGRSIADRLKNL